MSNNPQKKRIAFWLDTPEWSFHLGTALEVSQDLLDQGHELLFLTCNRDVSACETNYDHSWFQCQDCIGRRNDALSRLRGNFKVQPLADFEKPLPVADILRFLDSLPKDSQSFKKAKIENYDVGEAILSSVSSRFGKEWPSPVEYADLFRRFLLSGILTYYSVRNFFRTVSVDEFYLFNGRFTLQRAVLRAIEIEKKNYVIHERGRNRDHYKLFVNTSPHRLLDVEREILKTWDQGDPVEREKITDKWYQDLSDAKELSFLSFVTGQDPSLLPSSWNPNKENIVIFTSAEYEVNMCGEEWEHHIYRNQMSGIKQIIEDFVEDDAKFFYVRVHPSVKNKIWDTEGLAQLKYKNFEIIVPESPVSSYRLLERASKIIVFGSTIGIEAAYRNKVVIAGNRNQYQNLGSTYNPSTHTELIELVGAKLQPLPNLGAKKFGYYFASLGQPFKRYKSFNLFEGAYEGKKFRVSWPQRILKALVYSLPETFRRRLEHKAVRDDHERLEALLRVGRV